MIKNQKCPLNHFFFTTAGFLNANGSPLTRGQVANYGLMDQMAVLQWVQENSVHFGGDPKRVTLVGHGTGAACIEYLTHSPTTVPGKNFKFNFGRRCFSNNTDLYVLLSKRISGLPHLVFKNTRSPLESSSPNN